MPLVKRRVLVVIVNNFALGKCCGEASYMSGKASLYRSTVRTLEKPFGLYSPAPASSIAPMAARCFKIRAGCQVRNCQWPNWKPKATHPEVPGRRSWPLRVPQLTLGHDPWTEHQRDLGQRQRVSLRSSWTSWRGCQHESSLCEFLKSIPLTSSVSEPPRAGSPAHKSEIGRLLAT